MLRAPAAAKSRSDDEAGRNRPRGSAPHPCNLTAQPGAETACPCGRARLVGRVFHHGWTATSDHSKDAFTRIKDHILLKFASALREADATLTERLTPEVIRDIVALVPDGWLNADSPFFTPQDARNAYAQHLTRRLQAPRAFLEEAIRARALLV